MNYKTKQTLKTIGAAVLALVVVGGAIGLGASLFKKSDDGLKTINPTFSVGGLTDTGKYEDTKLSIYTKEHFACDGLKVEVDFDSNVQYQAFFYDENDNFLSLSESYEEGHIFEVPYEALYARLEVTPIWEDDVEEKDKELGFLDVHKYANQLTVKVNEAQYSTLAAKLEAYETPRLFELSDNEVSSFDLGSISYGERKVYDNGGWYLSNEIDVSDKTFIVAKVLTSVFSVENVYESFGAFAVYTVSADGVYTCFEDEGVILDEIGGYTYVRYDVTAYEKVSLILYASLVSDPAVSLFAISY